MPSINCVQAFNKYSNNIFRCYFIIAVNSIWFMIFMLSSIVHVAHERNSLNRGKPRLEFIVPSIVYIGRCIVFGALQKPSYCLKISAKNNNFIIINKQHVRLILFLFFKKQVSFIHTCIIVLWVFFMLFIWISFSKFCKIYTLSSIQFEFQ